LAAYLPTLRAQFIWDDNDYVTANPNLSDAAGLGRIWTDIHANWQYYPLVFTTFWVEYHAWGLNPVGYHADNILLHALGAILLWRLLVRLGLPGAWLAAAIFAVHPVEVESVAWVTERKNVLCGVFYLSAMLVYFRTPSSGTPGEGRRGGLSRSIGSDPHPSPPPEYQGRGKGESPVAHRGGRKLATALALFVCAMLSKTVAATWPVAVLIILWWKNGRLKRRDFLRMIPFLFVGLVLGWLTTRLESDQVGAAGHDWDLTAADRCIVAARAIWFYAEKAVLPLRLTFIYPRWDLQAQRSIQVIAALAVAAVLAGSLLVARRIGRTPAAVGLLFAVTLLPALGFVNYYPMRYSFVADHFQYLAIIALIVPAAAILWRCCGRGAVVVLIPLAVLTWRQCGIYHDPVTLWTDTVAKNDGSWMVHAQLGQAWQAEGRNDLAETQFKIAAAEGPDEVEVWWKLGAFLADEGRLSEAEGYFRRAVQVDPTYEPAQVDLAKVLQAEQRSKQGSL
jgi:protein O-mannosyl-transferase